MGGGSNKASKAAERRQAETEARILQNTQKVNSIFDDPARQAQIGTFTDAVRAQYREELDRQKTTNDLQLKFALARGGQAGGSLDVDKKREAGEAFNRGLIDVERSAQGQAADLRASDEQSRNSLLALVQGGGDIGTAQGNAATSLRNNLLAGQASTNVKSLGDAFSDFGKIYKSSKERSDYRRGLIDYNNQYGSAFGFGTGGTG